MTTCPRCNQWVGAHHFCPYRDFRSPEIINAEARAEELAERLRKMDAELVETRKALHASRRTIRGLLDGDRWHRCREWDEMWINDLMPEFEHCLCFKAASQSEPAEGRPSPEIPAIPDSKG